MTTRTPYEQIRDMIAPGTISYGTASCGHAGQIFKTGLCAHCHIAKLEEVMAFYQDKSFKAERDCLTLALRLYAEDDNTFSPETREVMKRWRPKCFDVLKAPLPKEGA